MEMKAMHGKNKVLFFRELARATIEPAKKLVFQTEHVFSYSNETDSIKTKDGDIISSSGVSTEVAITAIQAVGDPVIEFLRNAVINTTKLEMWEVNVDDAAKVGGEYPAIYCQGYLNEWEDPANAEDFVETSTTFSVEQVPQWGFVTLTGAQAQAVQYAFRNLLAQAADVTVPTAPVVSPITSKSVVATGTTEAYATITAKVGQLVIGTVKANGAGAFVLPIPAQPSTTVINFTAKDGSGNVSVATPITVSVGA